ncbi:MarR family transcriptional regulator [Brachybacterium endophyticum]|uniref:MarR family transcriptional regulator n=1 Tax=Brachybacterium endophyticum TaxID=2182385 RepID=A0A2U2RPP9_9MICO|nr:MarR family transcriptional regulator [Brachybacterium endophyticum]PWH07744.1 MarR family transcriptional regulator [Brachybacterium endophyticum]
MPVTEDTRSGGTSAADDANGTPEAPWLSAEEQGAWRTFLYGVNLLMENISAALEQDPRFDLSLDEYEILVRLSEAPGGRIRMSSLADQVVHSRSRLTHTVARLEKRGILERVRCTGDGRGREAVLTDEGMALLREAAPVHVASVRSHLVDAVGTQGLLELGQIMGRTIPEDAPVTRGTVTSDVKD